MIKKFSLETQEWVDITQEEIHSNDVYRIMNHAFYKNGIYVALTGFGDNDNKPADSAFVLSTNVPVVSMGVLTASIFMQQAYFKGFYLFPSEITPALLDGLIVDEYLFRDLHKESHYEGKTADIEKLMFVVNRLCPDSIRIKE